MKGGNTREELLKLVRKRRESVPPGYHCVSEFKDGQYECDFVVPWTKSASNEAADLMIIGQDWASTKLLGEDPFDEEMARLGHKKELPTNVALFAKLETSLNLEFSETYATDVFPFIKCGPMTARIPFTLLKRAARDFAIPQIEIVQPKMAICLGIGTFNAIEQAVNESHARESKRHTWASYDASFRVPSRIRIGRTEIYAVTHLGGWKSVRTAKIPQEWAAMACRFRELIGASP